MASKLSKIILWLLILGNIIGVVFGFTYWYGSQLLSSPFQYWVFIATCPLYALLFLVCVFMVLFKRKNSVLFYITSVGLVKYGLWTVVFWLGYKGEPIASWLFYWLIISHSIMALESIILFSRIEFKKWHIVLAWLWFGLNDYFNYYLRFVTNKVNVGVQEMYIAVALTVLVPLVVYWIVKVFRYRKWKVLV